MLKRDYIGVKHNDSEEHIWLSFINGDDASYEIIYKRYVGVLFQYGIQFTTDEDLVKDAIHDVFVKIYSNRTHLKKTVCIKFFLFTCLKNQLYNTLKRELIFDNLDEIEKSNVQHFASENNVIQEFEENERKQTVLKIMSLLTERQREVVYYRYIQELEISEICILMDLNYQSVQNLIQRSLKKMRDSFVQLILTLFF